MNNFTFFQRDGLIGIGYALVAAIAAAFGASFGCLMLERALLAVPLVQHMDPTTFFVTFAAVVEYPLIFISVGAIWWMFANDHSKGAFFKTIGLAWSDFRQREWALLWSAIAYYVMLVLIVAVVYAIAPLPEPHSPASDAARQLTGWAFGISAVQAALVAPVIEEIIFRGLLQNMLRAALNRYVNSYPVVRDMIAIVITAALFAAAHQTSSGFPLLMIGGMVMGFAYWRTGSLWPSIGVHFLNNAIVTIALLA